MDKMSVSGTILLTMKCKDIGVFGLALRLLQSDGVTKC